jgi:integrase
MKLLAYARPDDRAVLLVLSGTGLRAGELCGLRGARVDLGRDAWRSRLSAMTPAGSVAATRLARRAPPVSAASPSPAWWSRSCDVAARRNGPRCCSLTHPATAYGTPNLRAVRLAETARLPACCPPGEEARPPARPRPARPSDLRHTFATWLEDDGIPARVIDELMGHAATRRSAWAADGMSAMGAVYRHTTTAMEARIIQALDTRLAEVVEASG